LILLRQLATLPSRRLLSSLCGSGFRALESELSYPLRRSVFVRALTSSSSSSLLRSRTEIVAACMHHLLFVAFTSTKGIPVRTAPGMVDVLIFSSSLNSNLAPSPNQSGFEGSASRLAGAFFLRFPSSFYARIPRLSTSKRGIGQSAASKSTEKLTDLRLTRHW